MNRRRGKRKNSTMSIMFMIAFLLAVLVGLTILMAPETAPVPPVSVMTYQERPTVGDESSLPLAPYREDQRPESNDGESAPPGEDETTAEATDEPEGDYRILGTVVDAETQAPVANARILARRVPSEDEVAVYEEKDARIIATQDTGAFDELVEEKQRLWADAGGRSDANGQFTLSITEIGEYKISANSQSHLKKEVDKQFVGEGAPVWNVSIELESGATISGRITDSFDKAGVPGIEVHATGEDNHYFRHTTSDDEGNYTLAGLSPTEYTVIANIEKTAYRVTKELPFRRTTISAPDQAVSNIDFTLDKGGVVWGYVTTPDDDPIQADVVLCTSDSILSQALSALTKQAPPLNTNSRTEDGYYELVGVPLNEPWRLHATAADNAPQLADAFLLTDRKKEARVDIYMFTGTNVFGQVIDDEGTGVPAANVVCVPSYGQILAPMDTPKALRETSSDEEGYFEVKELPAGNYQVLAQKEGFKYALRGEPLYSDGYNEIKNLRVLLESIEAGKYSVFGTVTDSEGSALAGAHVTLGGLGTESLQGVGRETNTDGRGAFEFEGVEIGKYVLRAGLEGYSPRSLGRVLLDEPNHIVLQSSSVVRGRVLAERTNTGPEGGYTVTAMLLEGGVEEEKNLLTILSNAEEGMKSESFNDPLGNYEISLSAGTWQLEGNAGGLTPKRVTITLEAGENRDGMDIVLSEDGGIIRGRVLVTDGSNAQGTTVSLLEASNISQALTDFAQDGGENSQRVDSDGAFTFEKLPEGTYYAIARHPAYPQAMSTAIPLEDSGIADGVEIRMGPGGRMEGFVFSEGRPMSGWVVTLIANGAPHTGTTDDKGAYKIENLPEGNFQAFAASPGIAAVGQGEPVQIGSGMVTHKNFGEMAGVTIHVTIAGSITSDLIPIDAATVGGRIALSPAAAIPVIGSGILVDELPPENYTVVGEVVSITDVSIGTWRIDYYAPESRVSGTYAWRSFAEVEVTGEETDIDVVVSR